MFHSWVCPKLVYCLCVRNGLEASLCIMPLILDSLWRELLSNFSFLTAFFFQGLGLAQLWAFPSWAHSLLFLLSCCHFLPHHFVVPIVVLFDPCFLGLFGSATYSSSNDSIWLLILYSCYFGLFLTHFIACGLFYPISFSWASLAHLLSLGILVPFSNSAYLWAFTNFLGFP